MYPRSEESRAWWKLLACASHTWPNQTCDACHQRMLAKLEKICEQEVAAEKAATIVPQAS